MRGLVKTISENTAVSLSLLIVILGGSGYVTFVAFQGSANAEAIRELKEDQKVISKVAEDVSVIKTKVEYIEKRLDVRRK